MESLRLETSQLNALPGGYRYARRVSEQARIIRLRGEPTGTITVAPEPNDPGKYLVLAGRHIAQGALDARLPRITVQLVEPDTGAAVQALRECAVARDTPAIPFADRCRQILDAVPACTHADLAALTGWSRNAITYHLLFLTLPKPVQTALESGLLRVGHAKVLCGAELRRRPDLQVELSRQCKRHGWSVRDLEAAVKGTEPARGRDYVQDPDLKKLEEALSERLGLEVSVRHTESGTGTIMLQYSHLDHVDRLLEELGISL